MKEENITELVIGIIILLVTIAMILLFTYLKINNISVIETLNQY